MTQQEIEAFALQYYGIECLKIHATKELLKPLDYFSWNIPFVITNVEHIELRSIDSLTNEECVSLLGCNKNGVYALINTPSMIDKLRSIGIAVPFRGYSVEQMIEQGILKLNL